MDLIPKKIHFFPNGDRCPEIERRFVTNFESMHPGWETIQYEKAPDDMPPELVAVQTRSSKEVADEITKLWVLYSRGGIIANIDVWFIKPIDFITEFVYFISSSGVTNANDLCVAGSTEGNPNLANILARISSMDVPPAKKEDIWSMVTPPVKKINWFAVNPFRSSATAREAVKSIWTTGRFDIPDILIKNGLTQAIIGISMRGGISTLCSLTDKPAKALVKNDGDPKIEASILDMGFSLGKAILHAGVNLLAGNQVLVTDEELKRREDVCTGGDFGVKCEFYAGESGRCAKCGCKLKAKQRLAGESCPMGKW